MCTFLIRNIIRVTKRKSMCHLLYIQFMGYTNQSMGSYCRNVLHETISRNCSRIHRERSHQADHISLKKSSPSSQSVLIPKALKSRFVLKIAKFVRLHQSFNVVERIVEYPIRSSTCSSCNYGHVDRHIFLINSWRSKNCR
jgi:hypothetical protein